MKLKWWLRFTLVMYDCEKKIENISCKRVHLVGNICLNCVINDKSLLSKHCSSLINICAMSACLSVYIHIYFFL